MRVCIVEGCGKRHNARGYCITHYGQMVKGKVPQRQREADAASAAVARIEDLQWMAETGESLAGAARRLGIGENALEVWLTRNGQPELLATLRSHNARDHNAPCNATAVWVQPAKARYRARKKAAA